MAEYELTLFVDTSTAVSGGKWPKLYGFKAAGDNHPQSKPLVWFGTDEYATKTSIKWDTRCWVYVANPRRDKEPLTSYSPRELRCGQQFLVDSVKGTGEELKYEDPTHMAVINKSGKGLRTGLAGEVSVAGVPVETSPYCENPLVKGAMTTFKPVEKVILFIAQSSGEEAEIKKGIVVENALSSGVVIDAAAAVRDEEDMKVHFNEKKGIWRWPEGAAWARSIGQGDDLTNFIHS
ncbi:hypothetical protein [Streptomyces noursei]|uniref:hypothetical protein n=1 Tax=Streptomyces noursei TaxID=1971 RepID=UPI00196309AA|nr:hypothetical protein [Streptomyces noursei]QRX91886.1 hypothetical protein JNO44_14380 [Streptomyces noursei]